MEGLKPANKFVRHNESTNYWTDGEKVYFRHYWIKGADIESFEHFPGSWAKDKKHCYCTSTRMQGADPVTFTVLNFAFVKDKNSVWTLGGRMADALADTFEVCDDGKHSTGQSYEKLDDGTVKHYELFVPYGFAKDANNVYYENYQGKAKIVRKAITGSFVSLNDSYFGYDEKSVFCGAASLPKANPATWKKLHNGYYYSKDQNRIYYFNRQIKEADADTFEVLVIPCISGNPGQYAKDKNHYYLNDTITPQEEIEKMIQNDHEHNRKMKERLGL